MQVSHEASQQLAAVPEQAGEMTEKKKARGGVVVEREGRIKVSFLVARTNTALKNTNPRTGAGRGARRVFESNRIVNSSRNGQTGFSQLDRRGDGVEVGEIKEHAARQVGNGSSTQGATKVGTKEQGSRGNVSAGDSLRNRFSECNRTRFAIA